LEEVPEGINIPFLIRQVKDVAPSKDALALLNDVPDSADEDDDEIAAPAAQGLGKSRRKSLSTSTAQGGRRRSIVKIQEAKKEPAKKATGTKKPAAKKKK